MGLADILFKAKGREKGASEPAERLAQEMMPLRTIEGCIIRRTDGKSVTMTFLAGTNDSLFTYGQKLDEAWALSACLVSINHPATILKLPKSTDSGSSLVLIDRQLAELAAEIEKRGVGNDMSDPRVIRYRLLKEVVRPEAEEESLLGDREVHPTYICMEFGEDSDDDSIMRDTRILVEQVLATGRHAHVCEHAEIVEALQLYFTPHSAGSGREAGRGVVGYAV